MFSLLLLLLAHTTTASPVKRPRLVLPSVPLPSSSLPKPTSAAAYASGKVAGITSVNWTTVTCDALTIEDASVPAHLRWANADANTSWKAALEAWHEFKPKANQVKLRFPAFISNFYTGPENWDCQDIANSPCSKPVRCSAVNHPAGYLILNSFAKLHNLYQIFHESLQNAEQGLSAQISSLVETFAHKFHQKTEQQKLKIGLDVFQICYAAIGAATWGFLFEEAGIFGTTANKLVMKDSVNGFVIGSLALSKDSLSLATQDFLVQNSMVAEMGVLFDAFRKAQSGWVNEIFSGTDSGLARLELVLQNGLMEQIPVNLDFSRLTANIEKTVIGQLIPAAWKTSPQGFHPFVLKTGEACSKTLPATLNVFMKQDTHDQAGVCWLGTQFYVLTVGDYRVDVQPETAKLPDSDPPFQTLMGATHEVLNGKQWASITLDDIVVSSFKGYQNNGYRNGYTMLDSDDDDGPSDQVKYSGGVRTPGFFSLPVCTSLWNTLMNIAAVDAADPDYPCKVMVEKTITKKNSSLS